MANILYGVNGPVQTPITGPVTVTGGLGSYSEHVGARDPLGGLEAQVPAEAAGEIEGLDAGGRHSQQPEQGVAGIGRERKIERAELVE